MSRDALTHHLAIPKLYLLHGGLLDLPDIPFSYYPMNLDLLYLLPLSFGNDILPKYIHLLFGVMTAGLIYHYLKTRIGSPWGLCGALLWLSTPVVVRLSSEVYVDLGLGFFSMAALYSILRWSESGHNQSGLIFAGLWCGLALGTKYNALLLLAVLSLMIPFIYTRIRVGAGKVAADETVRSVERTAHPSVNRRTGSSSLRALMSAVVFAGVALIVFSPWMIRNTILKSNPVYPMLNQLFNPGEPRAQDDWSRTSTMVQNTSNTLTVRRLVFKEPFGYIALMPLRIFFEGQDDDPRHFDGKLNPFLPLFLIAALVFWHADTRRLAAERWVWFIFAVLFLLMAFFLAPIRIRYIVPILPAVTVLAVIGIYNLKAFTAAIHHPVARRTGEIVLAAAVVAMFGLNADYIVNRYKQGEPSAFLSGQISRDEYITRRRPEYPLVQYANANLAPDARILGLFLGQRRYYFDRDVTFNEGWLVKAVKEADSSGEIRRGLKKRGITHLMVRGDLFQRWVSNSMSPAEIDRLTVLWEINVKKLMDSGGFALFELE
ncbi:MAG: glycosyltransferase family 39 protein [Desulfosarcina sp.]|nr:glycosyltransferase family 39 protein [Desulfobacterales bacterium]